LTDTQRTVLEHDLELAWRIQASLLPPPSLSSGGWEVHSRYQPLGAVGGDYCDVLPAGDWLYFLMGDVSGKGVAAALLMSHLSATVRSLIRQGVGLDHLLAEANRTLHRHSPQTHYMTLVCGRAQANGHMEIVNAGHCLPIVVRHGEAQTVPSGAPPIGLFSEGSHENAVVHLDFQPDDTLLLYTDGMTEAANANGEDYGVDRLAQLAARLRGCPPARMIAETLQDLKVFLAGAPRNDDLALMALRRS
jgi:phosphoserine phosphatase RsbU/P